MNRQSKGKDKPSSAKGLPVLSFVKNIPKLKTALVCRVCVCFYIIIMLTLPSNPFNNGYQIGGENPARSVMSAGSPATATGFSLMESLGATTKRGGQENEGFRGRSDVV